MTLYSGQAAVKFTLNGLGNLSDASSVAIKYKRPDGLEGEWNAIIEDEALGVISYELLSTQPLIEGTYKMWAYVVFSDGRPSIGDVVTQRVYKEGEVIQ